VEKIPDTQAPKGSLNLMMMHPQIENKEILERYLSNQLDATARQAFEEHFFTCDECFEKLQAAERFKAGISDATQRGLLSGKENAAFAASGSRWLMWALPASACAAVIFAILAGWMYLKEIPGLRGEIRQTASQLRAERQAPTELEQKSAAVEVAEANIPVVMLQASRASEQPANILVPADASHLVIWIEIGPSRYGDFRMQFFSSQGRLVTSVEHLARGPYGALAASLPTSQLPAGDFRITLTGLNPPPASLVGEYRLRVEKH
jgi:Putative zinc-finger